MVWIAAVYIFVDIVAHGLIATLRDNSKREGPFTAPDGVRFWVIWNDPLASLVGGNNYTCTTILRTVGVNRRYTASSRGVAAYILAHECFHAQRQWTVWGMVSAVLFLPAYLATCWLGKSGPFEVPAYGEGDRVRGLPATDPERIAWEDLAKLVNVTKP